MSLKNSAEQIRTTPVVSENGHSQSIMLSSSDLKIKSEKVYDTSSPKDAFSSGLLVGDVIMMSGWTYSENNRVFIVTDIESSGEWIKVDKQLVNEGAALEVITIENDPESLTVTGITTSDVVTDVVNANSTSSSAEAADASKVRVTDTDTNTVSSFIVTDAGDELWVTWANLSAG